jgi:hypothetical protein
VVPMRLEFPDTEERAVEEPATSPPASTGPSSTSSTRTSKGKTERKRGQHGRHQKHDEVLTILAVGPQGKPTQPKTVLGTFSNQCSCIAKEYVPITYDNWNNVPDDLKGVVWGEIKRRFQYPVGYNEEMCKKHALHVASKALRRFRSVLNTQYIKKGKSPLTAFNFIKPHHWEEFVRQKKTEEAEKKSREFSALAKRNTTPHHLGCTGYEGKRQQWRDEERELASAGKPIPYADLDDRTKDFLLGRRPKRLKEGRTKFNEPQTEEAERRILAVAEAQRSGSFNPRKGRDVLTEGLGNPEHRG